jgi:hypothetical protein
MPKLGAHRRSQAGHADRVPFADGDTKILVSFADALRQEANALGMTAIEYALWAASEKMRRAGRRLTGIFEVDDLRGEDV